MTMAVCMLLASMVWIPACVDDSVEAGYTNTEVPGLYPHVGWGNYENDGVGIGSTWTFTGDFECILVIKVLDITPTDFTCTIIQMDILPYNSYKDIGSPQMDVEVGGTYTFDLSSSYYVFMANYYSTSVLTVYFEYDPQTAYDTEAFVTFDSNGGSDAPDVLYERRYGVAGLDFDVEIVLPEDIPVREGFRFLGWTVAPDYVSGMALFQPGQSFEIGCTDEMILYAAWDLELGFLSDPYTDGVIAFTGS